MSTKLLPSVFADTQFLEGTNTDAVLISLSPVRVIASHKAPTTFDVTTGITEAVRAVIRTGNVPSDAIGCVIIGTTHFVNAIVQRSPLLQRVGVVRLCGGSKDGFGLGIPPFIDFPKDLRHVIAGKPYFCHGGHQISGVEISPIDPDELRNVAKGLVAEGISNVVVSGIYSPLKPEHEETAGRILAEQMQKYSTLAKSATKTRITLSHQISSLSFLARENASILNAALRPLAERTVAGFQKAMQDLFGGSACALYLTQNDGSVLSASEAAILPIRTFNSGPTNSIRGGDFLWQTAMADGQHEEREDALVVIDIGGTTSDSGLLLPSGLPRMSSITSLVGGVPTNFALPAVESVGLGGGSVVKVSTNDLQIGPESVALELTQKSRVFGGETLTATDIAVAYRLHRPRDKSPVQNLGNPESLGDITPDTIEKARKTMRKTIESLIDRTKIQRGDIDVLIVGGGAILIDTDESLLGVRAVRKVKGGEVANAVGAAISRVSGVTDVVVDTSSQTLKEAQADISRMAIEAAVSNGAKRDTVQVVEVTIHPIQYVDAKARILVRAIGELDLVPSAEVSMEHDMISIEALPQNSSDSVLVTEYHSRLSIIVEPRTYIPNVKDGEWIISLTDLEWIMVGCKILGCGGGGDPYQQYLKIKAVIEERPGVVRVVSPSYLPEIALIGSTGCLGSPEVSMERMEADECNKAHDELTRVLGLAPVDGLMALEIGGGNGLVNFEVAAAHGVPCVDADYMGRAYPTYWQMTANVYGSPRGEALVPTTIASGDGTFMTMTASRTDKLVDSALRAVTVEVGCRTGQAGPPRSAKLVQEQAVLNTVSLAWWIGRAVALEKNVTDKAKRVVEAIGGERSAKILAEGKITNVERVLKSGHTYGILEIDGTLHDGSKSIIRIPFKNENAYVESTCEFDSVEVSSVLASVPDLITVLDAETGLGIGTPEYKYGLRVVVIAIAASPRWTDSSRGLELGGPASMGFASIRYVPIGAYTKPRSVIDTFS